MTEHEEDSEPERVTWDTDGITFYVDTCANTIISNCRELFTDLNRMKVTIDTHSGEDVRTRYVGTFRLELPDDDGKIWVYVIPDSIYDPHTDHNILGVARLSNFFKDTAPGDDPMALDGTTATSSAARTHLVWDKRQHELHFMHRTTSHLPELVLYGGNSYFRAFFSRVSRVYDGMVRHAFCTNYTVAPESSYVTDDEGENGMEEDSDDEDDLNREQKWYQPNYCRPCNTPESPFILGQNLILKKKGSDGKSIETESVIYEGVDSTGSYHTVRREDGKVIAAYEQDLVPQLQPSFDNIPHTPRQFQSEVGKGITQAEAQELARPKQLTPIQQTLLVWHHRLYHLQFKHIFRLAKLNFLPKSLLQCEKAPPKCIECLFGAAKRRPWRVKGEEPGRIQRESEVNPGDGVSADQIVSAQPGLVPQMSGFLTSERIWGATTFVDHVTDYVYCHIMQSFTTEDTLIAKKAFEKIFTLHWQDTKSSPTDVTIEGLQTRPGWTTAIFKIKLLPSASGG